MSAMEQSQNPNEFSVTVLVDGVPENTTYGSHEKVEEVLKSLLPASQKQNWAKYQITDARLGDAPLDPAKSLKDAGVQGGDVLSFTKTDGGGGDQ